MAGKNGDSFADAINRASERPDEGVGANQELPSFLSSFPIPDGEQIVDNLKAPTPGGDSDIIKGIPRYRLRAHFKRFIMGSIFRRTGEDSFDVEEHDDSAEYELLLNDMLQGKAVPRWEDRTVLKDGTVILAVSYLTVLPKKADESDVS